MRKHGHLEARSPDSSAGLDACLLCFFGRMRTGLWPATWELYFIFPSPKATSPGLLELAIAPRKEAMCLLFHWGLGLILWILLLGDPIKTGAPERVTAVALLPQAGSEPASNSNQCLHLDKARAREQKSKLLHVLGRTRYSHSCSLNYLI